MLSSEMPQYMSIKLMRMALVIEHGPDHDDQTQIQGNLIFKE